MKPRLFQLRSSASALEVAVNAQRMCLVCFILCTVCLQHFVATVLACSLCPFMAALLGEGLGAAALRVAFASSA